MAVKHSKEADLRPFDVEVSLAFGLQDVQNDRYAIFVVFSDDALVGVGGVRLDVATLFLGGFRRLMILKQDGLGVDWRWVLAEEECLNFDKLDV